MRPFPTLLAVATAVAPASAVLTWKNVRIGGGGGFTSGIVFHPTTKGVAYARTDIGGLYRLNPADDSWIPVTDTLAHHNAWNMWGVDAVALDALDANKVYAAVGSYTTDWDPNNGAIIRSSDGGATWTTTTLPFKVGGNMPGRGMGERLVVDPKNSNILYFGARSGNGLWRSTDGGVSFAKVASFTAVGTYIPTPSDAGGYNGDNQGLAFVTFDSNSPVLGGATSRIFVGTADKVGPSLWLSEDAGATWEAVAGQPTGYLPHKGKLQPAEKALYLTYSDGSGPYDGTKGAVHRYDIAAGTWRDITPATGDDLTFGFGGVGLDMVKPGTLVVATLNSWWPDAQLFRSTDSGATWSKLWEWAGYPNMNQYYSISAAKAPWIEAGFLSRDSKRLGWMIEALEIDPFDSNHWLYGTGLTLFGGHDLTKWDATGAAKNVSIHVLADGIEETAVLEVVSAPGGPELLAAVGDVTGFTFATAASLDRAPARPWADPSWVTSSGVDYAGNKPSVVVRVGTAEGSVMVAMSSDGGASWSAHPGADTATFGGDVALSADGAAVLWASSNKGVLRSLNSGAFAPVTGLSVSGDVVVGADRRTNGLFYAGSAGSGTLYVSTDNGASFAAAAGSLAGATSVRDVVAHPTVGGTVFVSTNAGVFRSTDSGATFTPLPSAVRDTHRIGIGLGSADSSAWTLYALGVTGPAGARLYAISAAASSSGTWEDIQGSAQAFGALNSCRLAGSGNVPGQVYVGTNGRGVFVARGSATPGNGGSTTTRGPTTLTTSTTVRTTSTSVTTTPTTTTTSRPPTTTGTLPRWSQCGGRGWHGQDTCQAPWVCTFSNEWYSRCL